MNHLNDVILRDRGIILWVARIIYMMRVLKYLSMLLANTSIFWRSTGLTYHGKATDVKALGVYSLLYGVGIQSL